MQRRTERGGRGEGGKENRKKERRYIHFFIRLFTLASCDTFICQSRWCDFFFFTPPTPSSSPSDLYETARLLFFFLILCLVYWKPDYCSPPSQRKKGRSSKWENQHKLFHFPTNPRGAGAERRGSPPVSEISPGAAVNCQARRRLFGRKELPAGCAAR